jgi:hypothetical protein
MDTTIQTIEDNLSYFKFPIGNTTPEKTLSLHAVSKIVMLGELEKITNKVRANIVKKTEKLPYITPSGCFTKRTDSEIVSYSGIVCLDLDDIENVSESQGFRVSENQKISTSANQYIDSAPDTSSNQHISTSAHQHINSLKQMIFADAFLNPAFIFVSPLGRGLKIFIRIRGAEAAFHKDYFRVLSVYFKQQHGIEVDSSCSNISRACLLCHDPQALFSPFGSVSHLDLLRKLPPEPPEPPPVVRMLNSLYSHFSCKTDCNRYWPDKLNSCSGVHAHALACLRNDGWVQKGSFFIRPGKTNSKAISAEFSIPDKYSIYIFYNFSSNAPPFQGGKGYTDCQVIALLQYNGDYNRCISVLADNYKTLLRKAG